MKALLVHLAATALGGLTWYFIVNSNEWDVDDMVFGVFWVIVFNIFAMWILAFYNEYKKS